MPSPYLSPYLAPPPPPPPQPLSPATPSPQTPPPARRYGLGTVVGTAATAAVLAGTVGLVMGLLVAYGVVRGTGDLTGGRTDARPAAEVLPERLPGLVAWVEDRVGVPFAAAPEVEVLDDDAFERAFLSDSTAAEPQSLPQDDYPSTVHALGLVPDVDDYVGYYGSGFASGVVGFYDSGDGRLAVRGSDWTPEVEVTVVHELVHALQDQQVDLDARTAATRYEDETYLSLNTVIEGQATVVELDWLGAQSTDYQDEYWAAYDASIAEDTDSGAIDVFADTMSSLPYDLGYLSVVALEEATEPAATLEALRAAPTTTEQLYDLPGWRSGAEDLADAVAVPEPVVPAGGDVVDRGAIGVFVLGLLRLDPDEWFDASAENPVDGWAGDRYVTWELAGSTCTRVGVAVDDADAATGLAEGLEDWAEDGPDGPDGARSVVIGDGAAVTLEACVPTP